MTGPNRWERSCFVRGWAAFCVGVILATANVAFAESRAERYDIHIVEARLGAALTALALQTDKQLFFPYDLADAQGVHPVSGNYTVDEALDLMLRDTGFSGGLTDSGVITISRVASTDSEGETMGARDQKSSPNKRKGLLGILAAAFSVGAGAQETADTDKEDFGEELEEIVVTGTNIRGVENPTVPIIQFDREAIELSGAATVEDFLRTVPQNFQGISPVAGDSANPNGGNGSNPLLGTSVDLRGLGAGSTLSLLNGRRLAATGDASFVDVSVLPLGAIERVDVQTDGASAVYGTDAVGGVVNFITRRDYEGFDVNARYGTVTDGSREEFGVGAAGGTSWGGGGFFLGVDYLDQTPLRVDERDFVDTTIANPEGTFGPEAEKVSAIASLNQSITDRLSISIDSLYSERDAKIQQIILGQWTFDSSQEAIYANTRISYDFAPEALLDVFLDYGREKGEALNSATTSSTGRINELVTFEATLSGSLEFLPAGEIAYAIGASYREEENELLTNGEAVRDPFSRETTAVYGELLVPLIGDEMGVPFVQSFDVSLAGRYEEYSDFGDTSNPKLGLAWTVNGQLLLRGSYSESFRAPPLRAINGDVSALLLAYPAGIFYTAGEPLPAQDPRLNDGFFYTIIPTSVSNPFLSEETAETLTIGVEYQPQFIDGLTASIGYFSIEYTDRIEAVQVNDILVLPEFGDFFDAPPNINELNAFLSAAEQSGNLNSLLPDPIDNEDIQIWFNSGFQNLSERNVEGFDFTTRLDRSLGLGDISAGLNLTYMMAYEVRPTETATIVDQVNTAYRPPEFKLRADANWSLGGFTVFGALNYVGEYQSVPDNDAAVDIDSWLTLDAAISYELGEGRGDMFDGVRFGLNVRNLFDEEPPFFEQPSDGLNFDSVNADPFERVLTFTVAKQF